MIDLATLTAKQAARLSDFNLSVVAYELICEPLDGVKMEKAQDRVRKLPPFIRPLYTVLILQSEVENGGFNQYFWNLSGRLASEALDDLMYLGAQQHAALLKYAIMIEKDESPMMTGFKKPQTWDSFAESYKHTELEPLDDEFYKLPKLDKFRADHIRKNLQEVQSYFQKQ